MTGDLLARAINQATQYGELMFSIEEFGQWWQFTQDNPLASFAVGPGQVVILERLPVKVFAL